MISIFVCEDNEAQLKKISDIIQSYITIENLEMKIELTTKSPTDIIEYLKTKKVSGLYFLDIDLSCETTGVDLAESIRDYDPRGFFVFVTSDENAHLMAIKRKVEVLGHIIKGRNKWEDEICDFIKWVYEKGIPEIATPLQNMMKIKISPEKYLMVRPEDILFFKTTQAHFIRISYFEDGEPQSQSFRGKLSDMMERLDDRFFRCARDCIVNTGKITGINPKEMELVLEKGITVYASEASISELMKKPTR